MNKYHYHRTQHEEIFAESEEEAYAALLDRHPFDHYEFELTDVEDVPPQQVARG